MPISSLTTDYTGRTRDINIMQGANPRVSTATKVVLSAGKVSSYCAGVQKLLQRYTVTILTPLGSQPNYPAFGTNLIKNLRTKGRAVKSDLVHAFNFANSNALAIMQQYQQANPDIPLDEQIDTALLDDLTVSDKGDLLLSVRVYTKAGTVVPYVLPVPIPV